MKSIMDDFIHIEKNKAFHILNQVADSRTEVQIKIADVQKIVNTTLNKYGVRKHFYVADKDDSLSLKSGITIKIIFENKLFFLKTNIKKFEQSYYFDGYEHLYELVRRRRPRFKVPDAWAQSALIQSNESLHQLRSAARIIEMSKSGMKLSVNPELPRYEKNQIINLRFKIFRRAEIQLSAKIVHLKRNISAGPTIGVQFMDDTILLKNKIQNVCDDLAFFYAADADT